MNIFTIGNKFALWNNKALQSVVERVDPYNPLGLPPNTIRCKFASGNEPWYGDTQTLVDSTNNIWDIYLASNDWSYQLYFQYDDLLEVLGANTTNVTNMDGLFNYCPSLTSVSLFDTSNVTSMNSMFYECESLTSIPLFNTSKATNMDSMFGNCINVQSGALALYQQASTQTTPPTYHYATFYNCGSNTQTGTAELALIPSDWKDT